MSQGCLIVDGSAEHRPTANRCWEGCEGGLNKYDTVEVSLLLCDYNFSMFSYIHELLLAILFTFCNRVIDYSTAVITVISITGLNCAYTEYSDASIFVMYN